MTSTGNSTNGVNQDKEGADSDEVINAVDNLAKATIVFLVFLAAGGVYLAIAWYISR